MPPWSRLLRAPNRPVAFTVVFWVIVGALVVGSILEAPAAGTGRLVGVAVNLAAMVVLWAWLPWDTAGRHRWVAPAFLVAVTMLGFTVTSGWHFPLLMVAVAALGRGYRPSVAVWIVAGFVVTLGAAQMAFTPDEPRRALTEMVFVALTAAIGLGLAGPAHPDAVGSADRGAGPGRQPGRDLGPQPVVLPPVVAESPVVAAAPVVVEAPAAVEASQAVAGASPVVEVPAAAKAQSVAEPGITPAAQEPAALSEFPGVALLTGRERDVAALVGEGRTNREIAGLLYITEGTVKNHVSSVLRKLGLRDRTQLALRAVAGRSS